MFCGHEVDVVQSPLVKTHDPSGHLTGLSCGQFSEQEDIKAVQVPSLHLIGFSLGHPLLVLLDGQVA